MLGIVYGLELIGIWSAISIGMIIVCVFLMFGLFCGRWERFAEWAIERIRQEQTIQRDEQQDNQPLVEA